MYGMGDGAIKIMRVFDSLGIVPSAFMASDEFVRGHDFLGYKVKKLSEIEVEYKDFIIVVCFGSALPDVMDRLYRLSEKYELYAPDVPVIGGGLFDDDFAEKNADILAQTRGYFSDDFSKYVFDCWVNFRVSGKIEFLKNCENAKAEAYDGLKLGENEVYVDLGAYNGDTVEEFLQLCGGNYESIYALEPDSRNYKKLSERFRGKERLFAYNAAAWEKDGTLTFFRRSGRNSSINDGRGKAVEIAARSVDSILCGKPATFIKLDVEGCEKEALLGAANTISQYKPKLVVSLYHRTEDIIVLPALIKKLRGDFTLQLRHHPYIPAWDMNLYCF